jgi:PAS domain S-box-containing protein
MNLGRPALIMMVDDTPANLSVLSDLLSARGFKIAEDGESALEQLQYVQPDLILLDVLMPHLDGFTTCQRLKERPETRDVPVIFMTALTDTVEKVKGFELGAVDYITKPFQQEEVLARVNAHLALQQLKAQLKESEARLERIIDSAMDAIIAVDDAGRILLFNCAAERVFRCQAEEAIGGPCQRFLSQALCRVLTEYIERGRSKNPDLGARGDECTARRRRDLPRRGHVFPCRDERPGALHRVPARCAGAPATAGLEPLPPG